MSQFNQASDPSQLSTSIAYDDLRIVAEAMLLRLPLRNAELRRVTRVRELLDASCELARILAAQSHTGRVHCEGRYGSGDLLGDTDTLYETLSRFSSLVHEIAAEYRRVVDAPSEPGPDPSVEPETPHLLVG